MKQQYKCGRCNKLAWLKMVGPRDVALCCPHCGDMKFVERYVDGMVIFNRNRADPMLLPRKGTRLHECLMCLVANAPVNTGTIAGMLDQNTSETASQLTVLRMRGFVEALSESKGVLGGSMWGLTIAAIKMFNQEV